MKYAISKEIAKKILENKDQDIKILIMGKPGSGMSYASISQSIAISKWLAYFNEKEKVN